MAIELEIARLARILVDAEGITFHEAARRLRALTLEIVVGTDSACPAAHAAVLTAVSVGRRTFLGGVRVTGALDQHLLSTLPIDATTLGAAVRLAGAAEFEGKATRAIVVGRTDGIPGAITVFWSGWTAGVRSAGETSYCDAGANPLTGVAAGAMAVGHAFDLTRGVAAGLPGDVSLWGLPDAPAFDDVFLPGAMWLIGLGNLGQATAWALSALPYADPRAVDVVVQDADRIDPENWGTSVLVRDGEFGMLKTLLAEGWFLRAGFRVRRLDRRLLPDDRLRYDEPRLALAGLDGYDARRGLDSVGFTAIVDAGLGRTAADFDNFRVTVFHGDHGPKAYFKGLSDPEPVAVPDNDAYRELAKVDPCGAAKIAGASVAVPHVSAVAACIMVARAIALASGTMFPRSTNRRTGGVEPRRPVVGAPASGLGLSHAGRPAATRFLRAKTLNSHQVDG